MEDIWITGKRFWFINFPRLTLPEIILKEFTLAHHKENEDQFRKQQGQRLFSQEMTNKNRGTIPMSTFTLPSTMSSLIAVIFSHNFWV